MERLSATPRSHALSAKVERIFFIAQLERALRSANEEVARQPLPPKLQELVERLAGAEG